MRHRNSGMSLVELIVTIGIMSFVVMGAFQVFNEGMQLFRTNQRAVEAQASVLKLLSTINLELTNADKSLVNEPTAGAMPGIVFASPVNEDGEIKFDEHTGKVFWRRLICFYYVESEGKVFRKEMPIKPKETGVTDLGDVKAQLASQSPVTFSMATDRPTRLLASDISHLSITKYDGKLVDGEGAAPPSGISYDISIEAGDKKDRGPSGYYIKVNSRVSPRG